MNIKCLDTLDNTLKDKLKTAKKECMNIIDLSYAGVVQKEEGETEKITIYSLLPTLENVQFLKREKEGKKEIYMTKFDLIADISEESLEILLKEVETTYTELTNTGFYRGICIPEEIESNLRILECLSRRRENGKLDTLFINYTNLVAKIRQIQTQNMGQTRTLQL